MLGPNMATKLTSLLRHRGLLAGAGLLAFSTALALEHRSPDEGLAAEDITPEAVMDMASELGIDATRAGQGRGRPQGAPRGPLVRAGEPVAQ